VATGAAYDYPVLLSVVMGKTTEAKNSDGAPAGVRQPKPGESDCVLVPGKPGTCQPVPTAPAPAGAAPAK
jgi:hypothetical protein